MKARKKKNQSSRLAKKENILYKQTKGFHTRWSIGVVSVRYFDLTHPKDDVARWRPIATYVTSTRLSTAEIQLGDSLKEKGTLPEELADLFTLCQSAEPNDDGSPRYIINAA